MTLTVEEAAGPDVPGLASLIKAGYASAPSALVHYGEFGVDLERITHDALRLRRDRGHRIYVGRLAGQIVAGARVAPREFVRSSHIATVTLVVAPIARRHGFGRGLLNTVSERALRLAQIERLEMRVVAHDEALRALVTGCGWALERTEMEAVATSSGLKDLLIYTRDR